MDPSFSAHRNIFATIGPRTEEFDTTTELDGAGDAVSEESCYSSTITSTS